MTDTFEPFDLTIHLRTGTLIQFRLRKSNAEGLGKGKGWVGSTPMTERERLFGIAYTVILNRIDKQAGELVLNDVGGRTWIMRADSIAAAVLYDPVSKKDPRELGFKPPEVRDGAK